jgi:DNA modification methylase
MNIDESRIGDEIRTTVRRADGKEKLTFGGECANSGVEYEKIDYQGRYPSNVIGEIPDYQQYFYCPKVSRKERHIGFEQGNNHPTVKPVELMKYLVKLVTPKGGKVLDPFSGSGSTGMACVELDYEYTGCELDPEYIEIATKRIEGWYEHTRPDNNFDELF